MTTVAEALIRSGVEPEKNLVLTATVDDEIAGSLGMKYLPQNHIVRDSFAVGCEGTSSVGRRIDINTCFGGRMWLRISTKGKSAHGAKPDEGINAITPPHMNRAIGSGNAYHLWNAGIPAVFWGPGRPSCFHVTNEFVSLVCLVAWVFCFTDSESWISD